MPASSAIFNTGVSTTSYPFNLANGTVQTNFTPAQMNNLSGDIEQFGLEFNAVCNKTWPSVKIYMGEGDKTPSTWSTTFSANANIVADQLVFDGALTVNITSAGVWSVPMTNPFNYSGQNTLVVTIRVAGSATGTGSFSHNVAYSGASDNLRMYSTSSATATTGSTQTGLAYGAEFWLSAGATWTGMNSSDWNDAGNWEGGEVPSKDLSCVIPDASTTANDPILPAGAEALDITIEANGILVGSSGDFDVWGSWTNDGGTYVPSGTTIAYVGTDEQTITTNGTNVGSIRVENQAFTLLVEDDWAALNTGNVELIQGASMQFLGAAVNFTGNTFTNNGLIKLGLTDNGNTATLQSITTQASVDMGNVAIEVLDAMDTIEFIGAATFNELSLAGAGNVNFLSSLSIGGELHVTMPGVLSINGNITGTGNLIFSSPSPITIGGSVTCGGLTHDGSGDLTLNNAVTLTGDANFLSAGPTTVTSIGSDLTVGGNMSINSGSVVAGDVLTINGDALVTGNFTFSQGTTTINGRLTCAALTMTAAETLTVNGTNHSLGNISFDASGGLTVAGTSTVNDITTANNGDLSFGGSINVMGNVYNTTLGNFEVSNNLSFVGSQLQTVVSAAAPIVSDRIRVTGSVGASLTGPFEAGSTSGFIGAIFVSGNSGLILESGADITIGGPTGVGLADIQGALTTASGAATNRPVIRGFGQTAASNGRVRFRSTSRVNIDGLHFINIGADSQNYGIELETNARVLAFNSVKIEGAESIAAAVLLSTTDTPTVFQNFSVAGGSPANIDANTISGIRIEVRKSPTGAGNLYGVPYELDDNGVLFWQDPPVVSILTGSVLPSVLAETPFSANIMASGGNQPLNFVLLNAPAWLTVNASTGELGGTPPRSAVGAHNFAILVSDSSNPTNSDSAVFTLIVDQLTEVPVTIVTQRELVVAREGTSYGYSLTATGGTGVSYTWELADPNALPQGLVLTPEGVITGSVAAGSSGVYSFTAIATDSQGNATAKVFEIIVETEFTNPAVINAALTDGPNGGAAGCALSTSSNLLGLLCMVIAGLALLRRRRIA
ncbi:MAG: putative Ig domain-containing protein [Planctomycetes bacterium]|nr:putative Ig domain-containing protein [Planctomycetota bacterium]